jgi:hypothetical protein
LKNLILKKTLLVSFLVHTITIRIVYNNGNNNRNNIIVLNAEDIIYRKINSWFKIILY